MNFDPAFIDDIRNILLALSLCTVRMVALFQVFPVLGSGIIQGMIRNTIFMSLGLILIPVVSPQIPDPLPDALTLMTIFAKEGILGILLAFIVSLPFWVAESVGFFIDNHRGASMASIMDPMSGDQTSPMGLFISNAIVAVFFVSGIFLLMVGMIYDSYSLWPVFSFFPNISNPIFPLTFIRIVDDLFRLTFLYASPVVIVLFFSEFGLGLANRFAPQLNVFTLAFPIKSGAACFLLIFYLSYLFDYLEMELRKIPLALKFLNILIT